ncbi:MAG TPA: inorganic phosphate transporter [Candidatus Adamsella sp.]|nr:inorganic phosphate transporter [Candidatus Adamsella sp.]
MTLMVIFLIMVIVTALVFEYINGFHDAANAIATIVSTRVLSPRAAVIFGGSLDFVGALLGTHVAKTIGSGIVNPDAVTLKVILCALLAAVVWNLFTWFLGLPSSSSHALIGGLLGAGVMHSGIGCVSFLTLIDKVIIPMFASPIVGFVVGFIFMLFLLRLFYKKNPDKVNRRFRRFQLLSSGLMALSHGSNDAQKTMGIISLALLVGGVLEKSPDGDFEIPIYVICVCAATIALGTMSGGWKIIRTMGSKIIKLKPIHGFAAETSAASIILTASHFGIPLSTTHVISSSIMGVGSTIKASAVKWSIVKNIVFAWVLTIPVCMMIACVIYTVIEFARRLILG